MSAAAASAKQDQSIRQKAPHRRRAPSSRPQGRLMFRAEAAAFSGRTVLDQLERHIEKTVAAPADPAELTDREFQMSVASSGSKYASLPCNHESALARTALPIRCGRLITCFSTWPKNTQTTRQARRRLRSTKPPEKHMWHGLPRWAMPSFVHQLLQPL